MRYLATLYGLTMLSHQVGGFFGAWLGGLAFSYSGNYLAMWYADALFAMIAALLNLPIREPEVEPTAVPA
jgi:predicted MFS family arabinose efflux permease